MITNTMKRLLTVLFFTVHSYVALSINNLKVLDPQIWWSTERGCIDDVAISVKPAGIYTEVSYYINFSAKASSRTKNTDTLEVVWDFSLPEDALVVDSWLWVDHDIVRAQIMDKWTARGFYEGIVQRRQDPSILTKINKTDYQLRIFPLIGNSTRKVMIKIMVKNTWSNKGDLSCTLPLSILKAAEGYSYYYDHSLASGIPDTAKIIIKNSNDFLFKSANTPSYQPSTLVYNDSINGSYRGIHVPASSFNVGITITYSPIKLKDGIYMSTYATSATEGYYQMVLLPQNLNRPSKRKTVFLVDYDPTKTKITKDEIYEYLKASIEEYYTPSDSFAIYFSGLTPVGTGTRWVGGDEVSKANVFNSLKSNQIKDYCSLLPIIGKASDLININKSGDIILISAGYNGYSSTNFNSLINSIITSLPLKTRFSVVDLQKSNYYTYINDRLYYNDSYFYSNLTRFTNGMYYSFADNSFNNMTRTAYNDFLTTAINYHTGNLSNFNISTSLLNGFCTGNFTFNNINQSNLGLSKPYMLVGKYFGTFPFVVQFAGMDNEGAFSKTTVFTKSEVSDSNKATETTWYGRYILNQEPVSNNNNNIINDILDNSLKSRVLSLYTAFLALEPRFGGEICKTCVDESKFITDIESIIYPNNKKDSLDIISVFPMPVRDQATVVLKTNETLNGSLKVYNMSGNLINEINLSASIKTNNEYHIPYNWSDESLYPNGIYLLVYNNGHTTKKGKIVIQR